MATLNNQQPGGIGGFDLVSPADHVIAYDYSGTGKLDHLVCYRPGAGAIFILKKAGDDHSPGAFAAVYHQGDPGQRIGSCNLADSKDRALPLTTMALASSITWSATGPARATFRY